MSEINITITDQDVELIKPTPLIAAGGVNENYVNFSFSEEWTGFTKTAVFYQDEKNVYYSIVVNNRAVVPWEAMQKAGKVYIGVFGVKDDIVLTSEVVSYKIKKGAITEDINPGDPTPDIYEQLIALINGATTAVNDLTEAFNDLTEAFNSITRLQGTYRAGVTPTTGTSVSVNMGSSYTYRNTDVFLVYLNGLLLSVSEYTLTGSSRTITITFPSSITFGSADYLEVVVLR